MLNHPGCKRMWFSRRITLLFLLILAWSGPLLSANNLQQTDSDYQSVVLQLKWKHQFQFAGYYAAKAKGYYRELGLEVEIREHQGRAPVEVMLDGEADYAVSGADALIKRANGYPVVALAAIYQHSPYALLVRGDSGIHQVSDLAGRRVMIGSGRQDAALHAMLKRGGLTSDDYVRLPSSFDANSLVAGETDAFNAYMTDQGFLLGEAGVAPRYIIPKDYGIDFYGDVLITTEQQISENPEQVENFRNATLKGWAYALANRDEIVDLILQKYNTQGMSRAHLVYEANLSKELIQPLLVEVGYMHPERWRQIHEIFIELNFLGENSRIEGLLYQARSPIPDWLSWSYENYIFVLIGVLTTVGLLLSMAIVRLKLLVRKHTVELIEKERGYRTIFDAAPEGMWVIDPERKTLDVNERLRELLGYSKEEMQGKTPMEFVDEANKLIFIEQTNKISKTDRRSYDVELQHKDGYNIPTHFSAVTLRQQDGSVFSSIAFVEDITERKRLEAELRAGEQNLRRLINSQPACVSTIGKDGELLSINPKGLEIIQAESLDQLPKTILFDLIDEPYKEAFEQINQLVFNGQSTSLTFSITGLKGRHIWLETHAVPIMDSEGAVIEHLGLTHDVTDRLNMEMQVYQEREFLQTVIDNITDAVMVIDTDLQIQLLNKSVKRVLKGFGFEREQPKYYFDLPFVSYPADGSDAQNCPVHRVLENGRQASAILSRPFSSNSSSLKRVEVIASPLLNSDGTLRGVIEVARDITEHLELLDEVKQQKDNLQHLAHHDSLTNLPNRALFLMRLQQAISKAKRSNTQLAVLFVDLDRFKEINDSLGHAVGDMVLKEVAKRFSDSVREEDLLARLGGDEFTFISEGLNKPQHAAIVAQQIIHSLELPFEMDNHQFFLTASIGISVYPQDGRTVDTLLRNADAAMYKAKDEGKNTFQYYTADMTEQAFERIFLESSLRRALVEDQLVVYYQPQYATAGGDLIGVEALVRWMHPDMGMVSPSRFIPLAEDTGLIISLGEQVLRIACKQMASWNEQDIAPKRLAVNLSVKQISSAELIPTIKTILEETGCRAEWLEFEVTEGFLMKDPEASVSILQQLRDLGADLAVDDFGTGYSSLAYLKRFPLTRLKIDRSFIHDVPGDGDDVAITRAIIAMAKNLNLNVLAEGVENEEQRSFLVAEGCNDAQGFYFGRPLSAADTSKLLIKEKASASNSSASDLSDPLRG
ncbi:MAG: EAL domain-containing protein [Candidatus Thiodiazotropha lotti]|uniref:cyclic-guanylate-specific phosphodiesterase n=1 Tax=Candidatus Thiodiazotropha lotti TaxID=2792787 RepID=A0A9E4K514_9GAMM|nr:EAL domain-containing protein [Candidatus Thiodiazotropha lotti]MCW4203587.1 EAL domain-containing protein [Candidatus Thiodiazotropha lotti]